MLQHVGSVLQTVFYETGTSVLFFSSHTCVSLQFPTWCIAGYRDIGLNRSAGSLLLVVDAIFKKLEALFKIIRHKILIIKRFLTLIIMTPSLEVAAETAAHHLPFHFLLGFIEPHSSTLIAEGSTRPHTYLSPPGLICRYLEHRIFTASVLSFLSPHCSH